jgi:LPS sulfotransferase NodH
MNNTINVKFKNYEFAVPANKSILILTTPRTGSNALCSVLEKITGKINLAEIFAPYNALGVKEWLHKYQDCVTIIKMFPTHTIDPIYYQKILKNSFVIGLYRRDFLAQALSYVIAFKTNTYASNCNRQKVTRDAIDIQNSDLDNWGKLVADQRNQYSLNRDLFDIELAYEDIIDDLAECDDHAILEKVANYDQLLDELQKLFPEHTYDL